VLSVAAPFRKGSRIAGPQFRLAAIFDQDEFAFEHEYKFILVRVPMTPTRPPQPAVSDVYAELSQAARVAEPLADPVG
jgi:hypothetical protein